MHFLNFIHIDISLNDFLVGKLCNITVSQWRNNN